jgi:hypothetical protein
MKKNQIIKTLTFFCVLTYSFLMPTIQAQHLENSTTKPGNKDFRYYSKKQKNQKTTAWILLTGGAVLSVSGMVAQAATATMDLVTIMAGAEPEEFSQTGTYVAFAGLATMATSIPFFIASGKNKKRANISLQQQKITMGNKISQQSNYHSICLSISLGK